VSRSFAVRFLPDERPKTIGGGGEIGRTALYDARLAYDTISV